jgi:triacylglycerol lipase
LAQGSTGQAPTPVLLVPGWSDGREDLEPLRERFLLAGWDSARVAIVDFRDPVGSNREHAREIALAAAALRVATGASRIDVVAHSMGGLALRYHLRHQASPQDDVRRVVFLATPHFGTYSSLVAWGEGAREMYPGSDFLMTLMEGRPVPEGIDAVTIRTPLDLHILPPESALIPGIRDLQVCCPTHAGLLEDDGVFRVIEGFLRREEGAVP